MANTFYIWMFNARSINCMCALWSAYAESGENSHHFSFVARKPFRFLITATNGHSKKTNYKHLIVMKRVRYEKMIHHSDNKLFFAELNFHILWFYYLGTSLSYGQDFLIGFLQEMINAEYKNQVRIFSIKFPHWQGRCWYWSDSCLFLTLSYS